MPPRATDPDDEMVGRGHQRALPVVNDPRGEPGLHMLADDERHGGVLEASPADERSGAAGLPSSSAGWNSSLHGASQSFLGPFQKGGGAQQARHVDIVAAGVHPLRDPGLEREPGLFLDREAVHVRPESDGRPGAVRSDHRGDPVEPIVGRRLDAEFVQPADELGPRRLLLPCDLGLPVEVGPPRSEGRG